VTTSPDDEAFDEGMQARRNNVSERASPYPPGHPQRASWDAGWHESDRTDTVNSTDLREPGFYWIDRGDGAEPAHFDGTGWLLLELDAEDPFKVLRKQPIVFR
jgi:hypothetical protein